MRLGVSMVTPMRVVFDDLDAGAVVYHANYLKFCERARNELLAGLGWSFATLLAQDLVLAVVGVEMRYRRPLRMQDIWVVTRLVDASLKRLTIRHSICTLPPDAAAVAGVGDAVETLPECAFSAEHQLVCTSFSTLTSCPLPGGLRDALVL